MTYLYDFGDSWEHEILVEKIEQGAAGMEHPECLTGKRACPIEDCGGIHGYQRMVDILADPAHAQRQEILDWVGKSWMWSFSDVSAANASLSRGIVRN